MFGNCEEKIPVISSNTNEWPQHNEKRFNGMIMESSSTTASSSSSRGIGLMDKNQQQLQLPLKCPRCDSSNTKFCYYNNYSLSQPRHFCKACKRYWTRGGTLRNVPVGGGCRKNKRVKRPSAVPSSSSSFDISSNSSSTTSSATNPNPQISRFSNNYMNPLLYGISDVGNNNLPMIPSRFSNSKVSSYLVNDMVSSGYGLNAFGLGFSHLGDHINGLIHNPLSTTNKHIVSSSSCNEPNFASLSSSSLTPSMAAFLTSSTLSQQKLMNGGDVSRSSEILGPNYHMQTLASLQDLQVRGNNINEAATEMNKEGNVDNQDQRLKSINQMDGHTGFSSLSSDPGSLYSNWSASGIGAWLDPTNNHGSSLTSLI